jgi:transposase-like protein
MGQKAKVSDEIKIRAVSDYLSGRVGRTYLCKELNICESSIRKWIMKYKASGEEGLLHTSTHVNYTDELKLTAVNEYLLGKASINDICIKYKISSGSVLQTWILKYNGHKTIKSQNSRGDMYMTKGRTTSYDERVEIVSFCISNNDNYQITAEKYEVSYQQVYAWNKKYRQGGPDLLIDHRGKRKKLEEMTESEKISAKVKLLEAENKRLQMENGLLKKVKVVERRRNGKTNILPLRNIMKKPGLQ